MYPNLNHLLYTGDEEFDPTFESAANLTGMYPSNTAQDHWSFSKGHSAAAVSSAEDTFHPTDHNHTDHNPTNTSSTPISASFHRRPSGIDMTLPWSSGNGYRSDDTLNPEFPLYPRRYSESSVRNDSGSDWGVTSSETVSPSQWSSMPTQTFWDPTLSLNEMAEESKPNIAQLAGSRSPSTSSTSGSSPPACRPPSKRSSSDTDAPKNYQPIFIQSPSQSPYPKIPPPLVYANLSH